MPLTKRTRQAILDQLAILERSMAEINDNTVFICRADDHSTTTRHFSRPILLDYDTQKELPKHLYPISKHSHMAVILLQTATDNLLRIIQSEDLERERKSSLKSNHPEER